MFNTNFEVQDELHKLATDIHCLAAYVGVSLPDTFSETCRHSFVNVEDILQWIDETHRAVVCSHTRLVDQYARQRALLLLEGEGADDKTKDIDLFELLQESAGFAELVVWEATETALKHAGYCSLTGELEELFTQNEGSSQLAAKYRELVWLLIELKAWQSLLDPPNGRFYHKEQHAFQRTLVTTINVALASIPPATSIRTTSDSVLLAA